MPGCLRIGAGPYASVVLTTINTTLISFLFSYQAGFLNKVSITCGERIMSGLLWVGGGSTIRADAKNHHNPFSVDSTSWAICWSDPTEGG